MPSPPRSGCLRSSTCRSPKACGQPGCWTSIRKEPFIRHFGPARCRCSPARIEAYLARFPQLGRPEIVRRLHAEIVKILREPEVAERLDKLGVNVAANTPEEFAAFQNADIAKWTKVIASAGLKLE